MTSDPFAPATSTPGGIITEKIMEYLEQLGLPNIPQISALIQNQIKSFLDSQSGVSGFSDMIMQTSRTGAGLYNDSVQTRINALATGIGLETVQGKAQEFALSMARSMWSEEDAAAAGMDYKTFTAMKAASLSNNGMYKFMFQMTDPLGAAALGMARGELFSNIMSTGLRNGDIRAYMHARAVMDGLFADENGKNNFDQKDYAGFSEAAATYLAGVLTKDVDPLEGVKTSDTDKVRSRLESLRKRVQEVSEAFGPLRDIYGTDIPKLLQDVEALSGQSIQALDSSRLRTMSLELAARSNAGLYTLTDVAKGKQTIDQAYAQAGYAGDAILTSDVASVRLNDIQNGQNSLFFATAERRGQHANESVVGASASGAADFINKGYALARQIGAVNSLEEFRSAIIGHGDPVAAMMRLLRRANPNITQYDVAAGAWNTDSYREAMGAGLGMDAALAANRNQQYVKAARELAMSPELTAFVPETRRMSVGQREFLSMQALRLAQLNPQLVNMSAEERMRTLQEMASDPNRTYITETGRRLTLAQMGIQLNPYLAGTMSTIIQGMSATESGRNALLYANEAYSQGRSLYAAEFQKQLYQSTQDLVSELSTTRMGFLRQMLEGRDANGEIQGYSNASIQKLVDVTNSIYQRTGDVDMTNRLGASLGSIVVTSQDELRKKAEAAIGDDAKADYFKANQSATEEDWEKEKEKRLKRLNSETAASQRQRLNLLQSEGLQSETVISAMEDAAASYKNMLGSREFSTFNQAQQYYNRVMRDPNSSEADRAGAKRWLNLARNDMENSDAYRKYKEDAKSLNTYSVLMEQGMSGKDIDAITKKENFWDVMSDATYTAAKSGLISEQDKKRLLQQGYALDALESGRALDAAEIQFLKDAGIDYVEGKTDRKETIKKLKDRMLSSYVESGGDASGLRRGMMRTGVSDYLERLGADDKTEGVNASLNKYYDWLEKSGQTMGSKSLQEWSKTEEGKAAMDAYGYDMMSGAVQAGADAAGVKTEGFGPLDGIAQSLQAILSFLQDVLGKEEKTISTNNSDKSDKQNAAPKTEEERRMPLEHKSYGLM